MSLAQSSLLADFFVFSFFVTEAARGWWGCQSFRDKRNRNISADHNKRHPAVGSSRFLRLFVGTQCRFQPFVALAYSPDRVCCVQVSAAAPEQKCGQFVAFSHVPHTLTGFLSAQGSPGRFTSVSCSHRQVRSRLVPYVETCVQFERLPQRGTSCPPSLHGFLLLELCAHLQLCPFLQPLTLTLSVCSGLMDSETARETAGIEGVIIFKLFILLHL